MGTIHALSTGQRIENKENIEEQEAIARVKGFLGSEINRLTHEGVERNWFFYQQEIEQVLNYPLEPETEEQQDVIKRVREFLQQEENITGKKIDRGAYQQYWDYLKRIYVLGGNDNGFQSFKTKDNEIKRSIQEDQEKDSSPDWKKAVSQYKANQEIRDKRASIHAIVQSEQQTQAPAINMIRQLQESQPKPQRLKIRDRLIKWLQSW